MAIAQRAKGMRPPALPSAPRSGWRWQHVLALVGGIPLAWGCWTVGAWLIEGPVQITAYRDRSSASWTAARVLELAMLATSLAVLVYLVRSCRRQRRLTWEAQVGIAGALAYWQDPVANFFQPIFLYSSHWTNLNAWCSQTPFVVNNDCGRVPEPVLFIGPIYAFGLPLAAIGGSAIMRALKRRFPALSVPRLVVSALLVGMGIDLVLEMTLIRLDLWHYPAFPDGLAFFRGQHRYPFFLLPCAAISFGLLGVIRYFKDDHGRTVLERGLDHLSPKKATATSLFATIGLLQLILVAINVMLVVAGPFSGRWQNEPAHIINGVCDTAGFSGTRYGPCPGDPGYRMPLRDLPGPKPPAGLNS